MVQMSPATIVIPVLNQVGIVVKDVDEVVQNYWNILGIGPWTILTMRMPHIYDRVYRGKRGRFEMKVALAKVGPVELKLLQPLEGPDICSDFLAEHGEGGHHLQYRVDKKTDVDEHVEIMNKQGFRSIMGGLVADNGSFNYIDATRALGTIWEVAKYPDHCTAPSVTYPADETEISSAKIKVKSICQVSMVVKDLEGATESYWNILGVGPWDIFDRVHKTFHYTTYYDKPAKITMKVGLTKLGLVEFELVQPLSGDSLFRDKLCKHEEGVHHLAFVVDDVGETSKTMQKEGFPCVEGGKVDPVGEYACFDTVRALKILWKAYKQAHHRNVKQCP